MDTSIIKKYNVILTTLIFLTTVVYFTKLDWGTPTWKKTLQIFETKENLIKNSPKIVELRNRYYSQRWEIFDDKDPITLEDVRREMDQTWKHSKKTPYFAPLSDDLKLDSSRAYILSVLSSDEGQAVYPLANINPRKFDFDPDTYIYGGFYYFVVGSFLLAGKILGVVDITPDVSYYFIHPEETTKIFAIVRSIGSVSVLLSVILLFFILRKLFTLRVALISTIIFIMSPVLLAMVYPAKPHGLSMFLLLCGLWFVRRIFDNTNRKDWLFAGLFLGLGAAALIVNLSFVMILILTAYFLSDECSFKNKITSIARNKNFIMSITIFSLSFIVFNYYIFLYPGRFIRFVLHQKIYSGYSEVILSNIIEFCWKILTDGTHWAVIPLFIVGVVVIFKEKRPFVRVISTFAIFYFLINILFFRHPGVWTISYPLFAVVVALGTENFINIRWRSLKIITIIYVAFTLLILIVKTSYHTTLLSKDTYLTDVGKWINENIPPGSSIGVPGGWLLPANYPAFNFFKYKLINFPTEPSPSDFDRKDLPEYLLLNAANLKITKIPGFESYHLLKEWSLPRFLNFNTGYLPTGSSVLKIYKKDLKTQR